VLSELIMEKRGLMLLVGATGSGKSTTIASMLDHRNENRAGHILTLEDPIEFLFKNKKSIVNQREIGSDAVSFYTALRNSMRQAPDCILIGEIRDRETMAAALAYAQSGHLVIATLHANNSYNALNRIISFFPIENRPALLQDLATTLKAIVSQRLVPFDRGRPRRRGRGDGQYALRRRPDRKRRDRPDQGSARKEPVARFADLRDGADAALIKDGLITQEEAVANADSASNLLWQINNAGQQAPQEEKKPDDNSFSEFTLNV
jgi:twitching motility protein PilU